MRKMENEIKFDKRNYRRHNERNEKMISESLANYGAGRSILIDSENELIAGNGVYEQAKKLGIPTRLVETDGSELIVVKRTDLKTDDLKRKYLAVADNAISDSSDFDLDLLKTDFDPMVLKTTFDIDLEVPNVDAPSSGYSDDDLERGGPEHEPYTIEPNNEEMDAADNMTEDSLPSIPERVKTGDLWQLGEHRLLCGDSTDLKNIELVTADEKIKMVFTDPPYGMGLDTDYSGMKNKLDFAKPKRFTGGKKYAAGNVDNFSDNMIETLFQIKTDEMFLWGADYYAELLENKNDGSWIVWDKRANSSGDINDDISSDKMFGSCFELCWSKKKHKRDIARIKWAGVFGTEKEFDHKRCHPTQKPILLAEWFLRKYSNENDTVLDIFGGSGSTLLACEQLKRRCRMMELDPHYCDVIISRWETLTGKTAVKLDA